MKNLNSYYQSFYFFMNRRMQIERLETDTEKTYEQKVEIINALNTKIEFYRQLINEALPETYLTKVKK